MWSEYISFENLFSINISLVAYTKLVNGNVHITIIKPAIGLRVNIIRGFDL